MVLKSREIYITRKEANFDRACEAAYEMAVMYFGVNDCGHSQSVDGWERSCCWIQVSFKGYLHIGGMGGHTYQYSFLAEAMKSDDEGDDE